MKAGACQFFFKPLVSGAEPGIEQTLRKGGLQVGDPERDRDLP